MLHQLLQACATCTIHHATCTIHHATCTIHHTPCNIAPGKALTRYPALRYSELYVRTTESALCVPSLVAGLGCNSHLCVSPEYSIRSLEVHAKPFRDFLLQNLGIPHAAPDAARSCSIIVNMKRVGEGRAIVNRAELIERMYAEFGDQCDVYLLDVFALTIEEQLRTISGG